MRSLLGERFTLIKNADGSKTYSYVIHVPPEGATGKTYRLQVRFMFAKEGNLFTSSVLWLGA